jgi:hypothetical protein
MLQADSNQQPDGKLVYGPLASTQCTLKQNSTDHVGVRVAVANVVDIDADDGRDDDEEDEEENGGGSENDGRNCGKI